MIVGAAIVVLFFVIVGVAGNQRLKVRKMTLIEPRLATEEQKAAVFMSCRGRCQHCRRQCVRTHEPVPWQAHFDHVVPYSWGGRTTTANLQLLCRECNMEKGARYAG